MTATATPSKIIKCFFFTDLPVSSNLKIILGAGNTITKVEPVGGVEVFSWITKKNGCRYAFIKNLFLLIRIIYYTINLYKLENSWAADRSRPFFPFPARSSLGSDLI